MSKYSKFTIAEVNKADIRDFIPHARGRKADKLECPFCGEKKLSVTYNSKYNLAKCWACDRTINGPIKAVEVYEGLKFPKSLEYVAQQAGIIIATEQESKASSIKDQRERNRGSFCSEQLKASGISEDDIISKVIGPTGSMIDFVPIQRGSVNDNFIPSGLGDEMIIYYYGLEGEMRTYKPKGGKNLRQYVRVRWSNPSAHVNAYGKEMKYQTDQGAPSIAYIPQRIRELYAKGEHIDTLFIQEGEKKAEKACKHGIWSIGIQGINNFGTKTEGLLYEIQYLAKRCSISNIVLMMDSDWDNLSRDLVQGGQVEERPNIFSKVVQKFKTHCGSLHKMGLNVDIWWGHVNENEKGDKGIDDLLANTLSGREAELLASIDDAMHSHDGLSKWVDIHKITAISDLKIADFWALNNDEDFFNRHRDRLTELGSFKFKRVNYKVEDGKLQKLSSRASDIDIYTIREPKTENGDPKVEFNFEECMELLKENGFRRLRMDNPEESNYKFINIESGVIRWVAPYEIRDFVADYISNTCKVKLAREFFGSRMDIILGDKKLERIEIIENDFRHYERYLQRRFYANGTVEITADGITSGKPYFNVWRHEIIKRKFTRRKVIDRIEKVGDKWEVVPTKDGLKCEFLTYIRNTCNMAYTYDNVREVTPQEDMEFCQHLVNKITAIGYLLTDFKSPVEKKAVVLQDFTMAEVGQAEGGSGKSLFGQAIAKITYQTYIDAKKNMDKDFSFDLVNVNTRNIFFDDVRTNFNFDNVYNMVTGDMIILKKGKDPLVLKFDVAPKILISTNNAINKADSGSNSRRIAYMEFSPWYSAEHTVMDDFGHYLFDDWDDEQWVLFDNFMAECVMFYMRSVDEGWASAGMGIVEPPMKNIMLRSLRQTMGEAFLQWALEYFDPSRDNLGKKIAKKDCFDEFENYAGKSGHGVSMANFTKRIQAFCKFMGLDYNYHMPDKKGTYLIEFKKHHPSESFIGVRDNSGGREWYCITSNNQK